MSEQAYWTNFEVKLELLRHIENTSLVFQEKTKQIIFDMRLQYETLESLLKIIFHIVKNADIKSRQIFINNVERVTFDPRLSSQMSSHLIEFLRKAQRIKLSDTRL